MKRDPWPYDGPIQRADGTRPYNRYLWPTERWLAQQDLGDWRLSFDWRIEIVALADGRFASSGFVHDIERGRDCWGFRCSFGTRGAAIRASAARMMCLARRCRADRQTLMKSWTPEDLQRVVAWAHGVVARETGVTPPRQASLFIPAPTAPRTGLPLLDLMSGAVA